MSTLKTRVEKLELAASLGDPPESILSFVKTFGGTPADYMKDGRWFTLEDLVAGANEPDTSDGNRAE
jgi:hypothetical protein